MVEQQQAKEIKEQEIKFLEIALGYSFTDKERLIQAFTTKSYAKEKTEKKIHEKSPCESQDSLRTLGDAILKFALIEILLDLGLSTPKEITEAKANLESGEHLALIFKKMKIPFACFNKGNGEVESETLFTETLEAAVAGIYMDLKDVDEREKLEELEEIIKIWFKSDLDAIKNRISTP
jgi:dsRNA-specific ribonuclease